MVLDDQLNKIKAFFGPSINFSRVRIKTSPFVSGNRPWACGNVIRIKRDVRSQSRPIETADLVHEFGHVWQHQNGQPVFLLAVAEQLKSHLIRAFDPYDFGGVIGLQKFSRLNAFLAESQAQIIAEFWKAQQGYAADRLGVPFTLGYVQSLERLVQPALTELRQTRPGVAGRLDSAVAWLVNSILGLFERE
jgi:hypothetical protein